jgi:hypothetical protein
MHKDKPKCGCIACPYYDESIEVMHCPYVERGQKGWPCWGNIPHTEHINYLWQMSTTVSQTETERQDRARCSSPCDIEPQGSSGQDDPSNLLFLRRT